VSSSHECVRKEEKGPHHTEKGCYRHNRHSLIIVNIIFFFFCHHNYHHRRRYFCHDVRVVRLPRHGASCPVGIGVSCSADRQAKAKITQEGLFVEKLETDVGE
jgi:hypothetical protein